MKILYAEDNPGLRQTLVAAFTREGHKVTAVKHGRALLKKIDGPEEYDLVITDNGMPYTTGIQALCYIREESHRKTIPVIVLTGDAGETMVATIRKYAGIYVNKMDPPEILRQAIRSAQPVS